MDALEQCDNGTEADSEALEAMLPPRFSIRDEKTADWLVRKLVEADAHIARVKLQAQREICRTEREKAFLLFRFGRPLETWAQKELAKHKGRRKSLLLLSGTVGFRTLKAKLVLDDEAKAVAWAKRHCRSAVVIIERLSKTTLNQHVANTGEVPNGAHWEQAQEKFFVR